MNTRSNVNVNAGNIAGRFKLHVCNSAGDITNSTDWINNLVTDFGLNTICAGSNLSLFSEASRVAVGSGSTTPSVTDVALVAQIGSRQLRTSNTPSSNSGAPLYYSSIVSSFVFTAGAIVGNIAEVGLFTAATGNTAATRALVLDSGGTPTTFTVLATETLTVTYELRFYPNLVDTAGTFNIGSTVYNYTQRCAYPTSASGAGIVAGCFGHNNGTTGAVLFAPQALPAFGVGPTGTGFNSNSYSYTAYTTGTFTRVETVVWGPTAGNVPGGIGFVTYGSYAANSSSANQGFFMTISPVITKTNLQTLTLTFSITYSRTYNCDVSGQLTICKLLISFPVSTFQCRHCGQSYSYISPSFLLFRTTSCK